MTPFAFCYRHSAVGACLIALASNGSSAQSAAASVSGIVRSADGAALSEARGRRRAPERAH